MYTWKINMKNGDIHYIENDLKSPIEMAKTLFNDNGNLNISIAFLSTKKEYISPKGRYKADSIAIISTDISSFEWERDEN